MLNDLKRQPMRVEILSFCLMPTHFHFLLKQEKEEGIYNFIRQFTDSYTRYFNIRHKRRGPLFEGRFKAIKVETGTQLLQISRYIHLNPYSAKLIKSRERLLTYQYSSLPEYVKETENEMCQKDMILSQFKSKKSYTDFVLDQADYQRTLEDVKNGILEKTP